MTTHTEVVQTELSLFERGDVGWPLPPERPSCGEAYWRSLFERERAHAERERARAEAAEARCEELRWAEVDSRARASSLKWRLDTCRDKLQAAAGEAKEVRRAAKDALSLKAEVARLEKLFLEAGVEPCKRSTVMSLRMEVVRLRKALQERKETIESLCARNAAGCAGSSAGRTKRSPGWRNDWTGRRRRPRPTRRPSGGRVARSSGSTRR